MNISVMNSPFNCPKCGTDCDRDEVDVGVGTLYGPYGCPGCGWSEDGGYDLSSGQSPVRDDGSAIDQYGGLHPAGGSMARAYRLSERGRAMSTGCKLPHEGGSKRDAGSRTGDGKYGQK